MGNEAPKPGLIRKLDRGLQRWLRTILYETRRTRRVIVTPDVSADREPPIFLIGAHRSGTTLVRLIVDSHSRIACPPESFFLTPLGAVFEDNKAMEGLRAMGFPAEEVRKRIRATASHFFDAYADAHGKPRWADKTPSYVESLELIESLYGPTCPYVMIYRHGLDAACSIARMPNRDVDRYLEACRGDVFAAAARYWADRCRQMRAFEADHPDRCFALRYEELTTEPEPCVRRLFEFVGEAFEPETLRFHEKPHDEWIGLQDEKAARSKGFEPNTGTWREQPPEVVERMLAEAGEMLRALGYTAE